MNAEIKTCLVEVETTDLEKNPEEKEIVAEQQQVPKEEDAVKTVRALKKRHGDRHLAVRCRRKPKKRIQGKWWILKEVGRRLKSDDPPYHSCTE
jgi:hypothetical protein